MKIVIIIGLAISAFLPTQGFADWMICTGGNVYTGDSQAQVYQRCGRPIRQYKYEPYQIIEGIDNKIIKRWVIEYILVYPASRGMMHYLFFENHELKRIEINTSDTVPK